MTSGKPLEINPLVVDWGVLGHAPPTLLATYQTSVSGPISTKKTRDALDRWDARLDEILSGERQTADVLQFG